MTKKFKGTSLTKAQIRLALDVALQELSAKQILKLQWWALFNRRKFGLFLDNVLKGMIVKIAFDKVSENKKQ